MDDSISRKAAIDTVMQFMPSLTTPDGSGSFDQEIYAAQEMFVDIGQALNNLPSAQEPLSDAYAKAVWTWLIEYQIKTAELKGRYAPYEVLSWVADDWRKEHERFNQQAGGNQCIMGCALCIRGQDGKTVPRIRGFRRR